MSPEHLKEGEGVNAVMVVGLVVDMSAIRMLLRA